MVPEDVFNEVQRSLGVQRVCMETFEMFKVFKKV